ncbi:MAG: hypothetical protein JXR94_02540 [Candidatus Hydrogenedentes bacterium]|nr:hypothetical protein [Candidatus Hydrogenedentota bacterium]
MPMVTRHFIALAPLILCVGALSCVFAGAEETPTLGDGSPDEQVIGCAILGRDGEFLLALPRDCTPDVIAGFFLQVAEEGLPFLGEYGAQRLADTCGKAVVPALLDLLKPEESDKPETRRQRETRHRVRQEALLCLGKIGAPEVTPDIVEFIETPKPVPYKNAYDLLKLAMYVLAHIEDDSALDYVDRMMTPQYWRERAEDPRYAQEAWLQEELEKQWIRKWTIQALSLTGKPAALERLIDASERTDCSFSESELQEAQDYWKVRRAERQERELKSRR